MATVQRRIRWAFWKWLVPLSGVAALTCAVYVGFHAPRTTTYRLTMTAGSRAGSRHDLAEVLRSEVAPRGLDIQLRPSAGSEEALDWVQARKIDGAFIQGGLGVGDRPQVRLVAMLHLEPLHLLVKKELYEQVARHLSALDGKTVSIGDVGSGTHTLSVAVLEFAGLSPRRDGTTTGYIPVPLGHDQEGSSATLPDAVFLVSSLPSQQARVLVSKHGYRLVPLPFGEAFALESLRPEARAARGADARTIDRGRTYVATIPAFTYGVEPPAPPQPLPTLGNRLLLVAHQDVDSRAIVQLLDALFATEFAKIVRPALDPKQMELPPELAWHAGAEIYRKRHHPLVSGDVLNLAQKGAATFAAGLSGLLVLWQWYRKRLQLDKAREFRQLLNQVTKLDDEAMRLEESGESEVATLLGMRTRLAQLRSDALDRFTEGELDDNELLASLLAHVNASRDYLTRLIGERRNALEKVGAEGEEA